MINQSINPPRKFSISTYNERDFLITKHKQSLQFYHAVKINQSFSNRNIFGFVLETQIIFS